MFKAPPSCAVTFICLYAMFFILFAATSVFRCIGKQWIYTPLVFLCSKILLYVATLFYLTAVSYHFPSVRLNNETTTCNEQHVYLMWRVSTSWRKQSTASYSNIVHERLIPHIELKRTDPDSLLIAVTARAVLPAVTGIALGEERCELSDKVMSLYFQDNPDYLSWTYPHITKWLQEICIPPLTTVNYVSSWLQRVWIFCILVAEFEGCHDSSIISALQCLGFLYINC